MEILLLWLFFPVIAAFLARTRGRSPAAWFLLGLLFGPFAWAVALLPAAASAPANSSPAADGAAIPASLEDETKKCPACAEIIKLAALKCRYCGSDLDPATVREQIDTRRAILGRRAGGEMDCPRCGSWEMVWAYTEDGSLGWWCPHCQKSRQKMLQGG